MNDSSSGVLVGSSWWAGVVTEVSLPTPTTDWWCGGPLAVMRIDRRGGMRGVVMT